MRIQASSAVMIAMALQGVGCSPSALTKDVVSAATPAAVTGGLRALDDPETQRHIKNLIASPEAKALRNDLIQGTVAEVVHSATTGVVREALRPQTEHDVELIIGRMARAGANGLSEADLSARVATALQNDLGPAVQTVARENIGPAMAQVLEGEQLQRALGATVKSLGRELVLGIQEGVAETQDSRTPGEPSIFTRMSHAATTGAAVAGAFTWVLGALALIFALSTLRLLFQVKKTKRSSEVRAVTPRLLREPFAVTGRPWAGRGLRRSPIARARRAASASA